MSLEEKSKKLYSYHVMRTAIEAHLNANENDTTAFNFPETKMGDILDKCPIEAFCS